VARRTARGGGEKDALGCRARTCQVEGECGRRGVVTSAGVGDLDGTLGRFHTTDAHRRVGSVGRADVQSRRPRTSTRMTDVDVVPGAVVLGEDARLVVSGAVDP